MKLRLTAFNCENLFGRYGFLEKPPEDQPRDYARNIQIFDVITYEPGRSNTLKPKAISEAQRLNTAAAILEAAPDIMAVCEVENLPTLRLFNAKYMDSYFDRVVLMDGNDPRGIDVGLLIRKGFNAQIEAVRSHADDAAAGGYIPTTNMLDMKNRLGKASFSRDCLEVDVKVGSKALTFLVNHFKAQELDNKNNDSTTAKRRGQAERVAAIVRRARTAGRLPIVLGDLNKDISLPIYEQSLDPLVKSTTLFNASKLLPDTERWTHFYESKKSVSQLDYILVDSKLKGAIDDVSVLRGGLSKKCKQYTGARLGTIEQDNFEASDHCPLSVDLKL
jgi:endonuclease/exonuclease/phosphatase family metal-dependent hydrolase